MDGKRISTRMRPSCPVLQKIDVEEQKELDRDVSISHIGFVNRVLRQFCE